MLKTEQLDHIRSHFAFYNQSDCSALPVYLDNAATTQKLNCVIDCLNHIWTSGSANVHRSAHSLANNLTEQFEQARLVCADFIHAKSADEIVWTTGTTDSINLVANTWGKQNISVGDQIIVSSMEHHANLLPWMQLCETVGAELVVIPMKNNAELDFEAFKKMLNHRVKLVAITHISNVLGTINPIQEIVLACHKFNCKVLVDGAQAVAHLEVDVVKLNCDFYAFSGHKCFAPEATGVLYAKASILKDMPPWRLGGEMVKSVNYKQIEYQDAPLRFEAGTPNISGTIAFSKAMTMLMSFDRKQLWQHEQALREMLVSALITIKGMTIYSQATHQSSIVTFSVEACHASDIATLMDEQGIAIRSGQLCAMPLVKQLKDSGLIRVSLCFYNSKQDIQHFIDALVSTLELLVD